MRTINVRTARGEKAFPLQTRTLGRGTRLYRWIPTLDTTWPHYADHEHITTMVFGSLMNSTLGGGLYASENPFDWFGYERADKLVILQLTEDVEILDLAFMMRALTGEAMSVKDFANLLNKDHRTTLLDTYGIVGYEHNSKHHRGELVLIGCMRHELTLQIVSDTPRFEDFHFKDYNWLRARNHTSRLIAVHKVLTKVFNIHINRDDDPRQELITRLECTDLYDLLNNRDFGRAFEHSWRNAARLHVADGTDDLTLLQRLYRAVRGEDFRYRSHDVIAGGGLERDGTPATVDTADGQRYLRATEAQYNLIISGSNHFIQMVRNGTHPSGEISKRTNWFGSGDKLAKYAVRYRYPGLHNFIGLAVHYPILEPLRAEHHTLTTSLQRAGFDPQNMTSEAQAALRSRDSALSERYHRFIQAMIEQLFFAVLAEDISISHKYQKLMSLHPFPDGNGRILRAFFRYRTQGAPLFMPSWDFDIFYSPQDFEEVVFRGIIDFYRIVHSLIHTAGIRTLTDSEVLWQYALKSCVFETAEDDPIDTTKVRAAVAATDELLFKKKLVLDIQWRIVSSHRPGAVALRPAAGGADAGVAAPRAAEGGAGAGSSVVQPRPAAGGAGASSPTVGGAAAMPSRTTTTVPGTLFHHAAPPPPPPAVRVEPGLIERLFNWLAFR